VATNFRGGRFQKKQPEGRIRRSQIVTTFGPGAMVDLINDAVLVAGLDFWRFDPRTGPAPVPEPRLRAKLAKKLLKAGRQLRVDNPFLAPPIGLDASPDPRCGIQVLIFPHWFVCQNPSCRALVRAGDGLVLKSGKYVHVCGRTESTTVPVRFVSTCKRGHLDDFPWLFFVHSGPNQCVAPRLSLHEGATGDFSTIEVRCSCGASRRMKDASIAKANPRCRGRRPWLGGEGSEDCAELQHLLVRTASNSYFTQVESAVSIPDPKEAVRAKVESVWDVLESATPEELPVLRKVKKVKPVLEGLSDADVLDAIKTIRSGDTSTEESLRTPEFRQFLAQPEEHPGELPNADEDFFARRCAPDGGLPAKVAHMVLAHKLREVRVQVGFTRIDSATADMQGEYDLGVRTAPLGLQTDWLPGIEIRGEGVFLQLDEDAVRAWERRDAVTARVRQLMSGYDTWAAQAGVESAVFPGARFYLLHSLSHLLIAALSLECGYAASAIRERLYCAPSDDEVPMAAILLSTGTPGTEGTLGGLVEQGRRIRTHLRRAFDLGVLCSSDPVCAGHNPAKDPTERWLEGAACHACLFVAECSCERFNKYLDRALVVPTIGHEGVAFFGEAP
jgi:Domain of unknown function (DUF1998)